MKSPSSAVIAAGLLGAAICLAIAWVGLDMMGSDFTRLVGTAALVAFLISSLAVLAFRFAAWRLKARDR